MPHDFGGTVNECEHCNWHAGECVCSPEAIAERARPMSEREQCKQLWAIVQGINVYIAALPDDSFPPVNNDLGTALNHLACTYLSRWKLPYNLLQWNDDGTLNDG